MDVVAATGAAAETGAVAVPAAAAEVAAGALTVGANVSGLAGVAARTGDIAVVSASAAAANFEVVFMAYASIKFNALSVNDSLEFDKKI